MDKPAQTSAPIHPLIAARWSPRSFNSNQGVGAEARTALAEAARWTPSCFGAEPWGFVFCDRDTDAGAWQKAHDCLMEGNQQWAKNAPLLVLACAAKVFAHNGKPNRHGAYDCGAAVFALVLEAEHQGLRCHQMAGFDADAARAAFAVPEEFECMAFIAIGKQTDAGRLEPSLKERELSERTRRPLQEGFFIGKWGTSDD